MPVVDGWPISNGCNCKRCKEARVKLNAPKKDASFSFTYDYRKEDPVTSYDYPFFQYDPNRSWKDFTFRPFATTAPVTKNICGNPDCSICNADREAKEKASVLAAIATLKEQNAKREAVRKEAEAKIADLISKEVDRLLLGRYWNSPTYVRATITTQPVAEVEAIEEETLDIQEVIDDLGQVLDALNGRAMNTLTGDKALIIRDMSFAIGRAVEKIIALRRDLKTWLPDEE